MLNDVLVSSVGTNDIKKGKFIQIFKKHKEDMAAHTECLELNGYQDRQFPNVLFTISRWTSQEALDHYRYSEYFRELWSRVKPLFAEKAEAHSIVKVY